MPPRITLAAVLVASFAASTAQTIVIAALPTFACEFAVSGTAAPWALTAFMRQRGCHTDRRTTR
jgi:hypothetical protein